MSARTGYPGSSGKGQAHKLFVCLCFFFAVLFVRVCVCARSFCWFPVGKPTDIGKK